MLTPGVLLSQSITKIINYYNVTEINDHFELEIKARG